MFSNFVSNEIGFVHLIVSVFALVFGTWVLIGRKGTQTHRRVGYLYAFSMILLIATALMIYRLFGRFGVFHVAALASAATLAGGMIPAILRRPQKSWLNLHFSFMYWSVFGLYAAFVAEIATRFPVKTMFTSAQTFFAIVIISTFITMLAGQIIFFKNKKKWQKLSAVYTDDDKPSIQLNESI